MYKKSLVLSEEEIERLKEMTAQYDQVTPPQNVNYEVKVKDKDKDLRIIIYNNAKSTAKTVRFEGKDAMKYYEEFVDEEALKKHLKEYLNFPQAGSDETGNGSFIGPICVTAAYVDEEIYEKIKHLKIRDTKDDTKENRIKIAKELKAIVPEETYETIVLDNKTYNEMHGPENNLHKILAKAHNKAYVELNKKIGLPEKVVIDNFLGKDAGKIEYLNHLIDVEEIYEDVVLKTEGERERISVAVAAYLATLAQYEAIDNINEEYGSKFKVGSKSENEAELKKFLRLDPENESELENIVKMHWSSYDEIMEEVNKEGIL